MDNNKLIKDFRSFYKSGNRFRMTAFDSYCQSEADKTSMMINPYIIEERTMNMTQLDVFSRLMMDRIIFFGSEVNDVTSNIAVSQLLYLDKVGPNDDITMYLNSPGGCVSAGLSIMDTMEFITPEVATVNIGLAASMGAMLLMSGEKGKRSSLKNATVMIHQPLGGASGQASDIEIRAREIKKTKDKLYQIIVECTGQPFDKVTADADRDYWLTAEEALEYGIIDHIITKKK